MIHLWPDILSSSPSTPIPLKGRIMNETRTSSAPSSKLSVNWRTTSDVPSASSGDMLNSGWFVFGLICSTGLDPNADGRVLTASANNCWDETLLSSIKSSFSFRLELVSVEVGLLAVDEDGVSDFWRCKPWRNPLSSAFSRSTMEMRWPVENCAVSTMTTSTRW